MIPDGVFHVVYEVPAEEAEAAWQRAFGGDADIIGATIELDRQPVEVVGVMPPRFRPPFVPSAELWLTPRVDPEARQALRGDRI